MDGENNGSKPYEQMDGLGVPLFLETYPFAWLNVSLFPCQADVLSLRTSQRCLQSELLKLRAQNAKDRDVSSHFKAGSR